jgi:hypothetical protein
MNAELVRKPIRVCAHGCFDAEHLVIKLYRLATED